MAQDTTGKVLAIQVSKERRQPMTSTETATAIADVGIEGDRHAQRGFARQVLIMDRETLDLLGLSPGQIKENITIEGVDLSGIRPGQVFFFGDEVTMEATGDCEPCGRMDEIRAGLRETLQGRRGILAMVLNGGELRVGDSVRVEPSPEALQSNS